VALMRRGEVWVARLDPNQGREIGKTLPVLVIQADELLAGEGPLTTRAIVKSGVWRHEQAAAPGPGS
jgi:mRNA interferase MazF